jgi:hypothetical protein
MLERKELRKKFKYLIFPVAAIVVLLTSSCSESGSTKQIRSTLFLLDASRSTISSVSARESQLRERLEGVFDTQEGSQGNKRTCYFYLATSARRLEKSSGV